MEQSVFKRPLGVVVVATFCCMLWGSAAPFIKTGYALFSIDPSDTASILLFAGIRFVLAGLLVILIGSFLRRRPLIPTRQSLKAIPVLAAFQTIGQYYFYYVGLAHTSGVNGSIITGTGAFFTLLAAVFLFRSEKMTTGKLLGCLLGFAGIVLMNLNGVQAFSLIGDGFILLSQMCTAISASFIKFFSEKEDAVLLSGWQFFAGGLVLVCIAWAMQGHLHLVSLQGLLILLHLAMVSAVAYTLWGLLLAYNPVSKVGIFDCLIPVMGVLLSAILLQESEQAFSTTSFISLLLIVSGVALVNRGKENENNS